MAPLLYLFGSGLALANLFAPRGTSRIYAVCGILLNVLGLLFAALGWVLYPIFLLILSNADFVGPRR